MLIYILFFVFLLLILRFSVVMSFIARAKVFLQYYYLAYFCYAIFCLQDWLADKLTRLDFFTYVQVRIEQLISTLLLTCFNIFFYVICRGFWTGFSSLQERAMRFTVYMKSTSISALKNSAVTVDNVSWRALKAISAFYFYSFVTVRCYNAYRYIIDNKYKSLLLTAGVILSVRRYSRRQPLEAVESFGVWFNRMVVNSFKAGGGLTLLFGLGSRLDGKECFIFSRMCDTFKALVDLIPESLIESLCRTRVATGPYTGLGYDTVLQDSEDVLADAIDDIGAWLGFFINHKLKQYRVYQILRDFAYDVREFIVDRTLLAQSFAVILGIAAAIVSSPTLRVSFVGYYRSLFGPIKPLVSKALIAETIPGSSLSCQEIRPSTATSQNVLISSERKVKRAQKYEGLNLKPLGLNRRSIEFCSGLVKVAMRFLPWTPLAGWKPPVKEAKSGKSGKSAAKAKKKIVKFIVYPDGKVWRKSGDDWSYTRNTSNEAWEITDAGDYYVEYKDASFDFSIDDQAYKNVYGANYESIAQSKASESLEKIPPKKVKKVRFESILGSNMVLEYGPLVECYIGVYNSADVMISTALITPVGILINHHSLPYVSYFKVNHNQKEIRVSDKGERLWFYPPPHEASGLLADGRIEGCHEDLRLVWPHPSVYPFFQNGLGTGFKSLKKQNLFSAIPPKLGEKMVLVGIGRQSTDGVVKEVNDMTISYNLDTTEGWCGTGGFCPQHSNNKLVSLHFQGGSLNTGFNLTSKSFHKLFENNLINEVVRHFKSKN